MSYSSVHHQKYAEDLPFGNFPQTLSKCLQWNQYFGVINIGIFLNLLVMLLFQEIFPSSRFIYAMNTNFEGTSKLTMSAFGFDLIFLRFFHALSKELIAMECFDVVIFSSLSLSRRSKASIRTKFKPNYTGLHYEKTMSLALPGRIHQCTPTCSFSA